MCYHVGALPACDHRRADDVRGPEAGDIGRRLDDLPDRLVATELADLRQHGRAQFLAARIHDEDTFISDLHGDVLATGRDHPHLALHVFGTDRVGCRRTCRNSPVRKRSPRRARWQHRGLSRLVAAHLLELRHEFRIHGFAAAEAGFKRNIVGAGKGLELDVFLARDEVRHATDGNVQFIDGRALEERGPGTAVHEAAEFRHPHGRPDVHAQIRRADERLFEVIGVVDRCRDGEVAVMPDEVFDHARFVAVRYAVAANPARLEVRGLDDQLVFDPLAGREPIEGVACIRTRVRAAIHPDRTHQAVVTLGLVSDDVRCHGIVDLDDRESAGAAILVRGRMGNALVLGHRQPFRRIGLRLVARGGIDRQTRIVAGIGARATIGRFFLELKTTGCTGLLPVADDVQYVSGVAHVRRVEALCFRSARLHGQGEYQQIAATLPVGVHLHVPWKALRIAWPCAGYRGSRPSWPLKVPTGGLVLPGGSVWQGVAFHFDPSGSRLNWLLTTKGTVR